MLKKIDCLIPIRSGSKSIKHKNIKKLVNKPLVCKTIELALKASIFNRIIIAYDSDMYKNRIYRYFKKFNNKKIIFYKRSKLSATSKSKTEEVIEEVINKFKNIEKLYLLQCTSPFISASDLKKSIKLFLRGYDSFFSGHLMKQFIWKQKKNYLTPINYKPNSRPRRQDYEGVTVENGSFYGFDAKKFLKHKSRLYGKIGCAITNSYRSVEIDEPIDFKFANLLERNNFFYDIK